MRRTSFPLFFLVFAGTLSADVPASQQPVARTVQNLSYSVSNHDQEIAALKQQVQNQETIVDSMHKEVSSLIKAAKESQKSSGAQVDSKLKSMDKNLDKLVSDLKQFKKHANETGSSISDLQKKLKEQEEISALQAQQIKELEAALRSLTNALQSKVAPKATSTGGEYKVKSGDSLDKIAKDQGVSVDAIRKANNLQKDTIYPGQKLVIPPG